MTTKFRSIQDDHLTPDAYFQAKTTDLYRKSYSTSGIERAQPAVAKPNSGETRANQEAAKYASIDFILNQFTTGGVLPTVPVSYADLSNIPNNLTEMQSALDSVYNLFGQLPASIRSQMNNDVRNYPAYVQSEYGQKQLQDAGILPKPTVAAPHPVTESPIPEVATKRKMKDNSED